jgi:hypothetical protein
MALSHNALSNYYSTIFSLAQHHKYSISEIENLIPFERDIYVEMLVDYLKEVEETKQKQQQKNR